MSTPGEPPSDPGIPCPDGAHLHDIIIVGAGPCGLAVAARLCEQNPAALFTDEEHRRFHWMKRHGKKMALQRDRKHRVSTAARGQQAPEEEAKQIRRWQALFRDHCDDVVSRYGLHASTLVRKERVLDIAYTPVPGDIGGRREDVHRPNQTTASATRPSWSSPLGPGQQASPLVVPNPSKVAQLHGHFPQHRTGHHPDNVGGAKRSDRLCSASHVAAPPGDGGGGGKGEGEGVWYVKTDSAVVEEGGGLPPMDHIYFATGVESDFARLPFLQTMLESHPIEGHGGFPCLNDDLMWEDGVPLFVAGRLAALKLGPSAPNLGGARLAAERIAWGVEEVVRKGYGLFYGGQGSMYQPEEDGELAGYTSGAGNMFRSLVEASA
ncbi:hypothetical protein CHGG_03314 [Chaetomium globosum CBS 148.51]|uniref:Uncharacterized protein n=1 Tax=Chaetomium globosum (strain ATCC 6205 / CBS 148.51 / DSM 1962 / NBRC 6347 / NRRL 1970) TaxID=306901 RepID=Q2H8Z0_CHAGB|nr:uncharacterized protein CHGG_03314 [Chaetomium globosum CBS 148.51]EAQ91379.1 hypothetical protein CHGG_03314 [Chaetomium globosum CBS 148.51]